MQQASERDAFLLAALVVVTQHLPSAVAVLDATGHVVLVNEPAEALLGLRTADPRPWTEQVAGHTVRAQTGSRFVAIAEWPLARALVGDAVLGWTARLRSPDGQVDKSVVVSAVPLRDPAGRLTGAVGIFADSSRHRRVAVNLSPRERQVLELIGLGRTNREIAAELALAVRTVKTHVEHLFKKLGVAHRSQAALWSEHRDS